MAPVNIASQQSGGLRQFVDLRQTAAAASTGSNATNQPASVGQSEVSQLEYLPYVSGQFTTLPLTIAGPDGLTAAHVNQSSATIEWSAASDNAYPIVAYDVQYRQGGSARWIDLGETPGTSLSLDGLTRTTAYDIEVSAIDSGGNVGSPTVATNLFTTASLPAPALRLPATGSGQPGAPRFAWEAVAGAVDGYNIIVDTNPADLPTTPSGAAGATAVFSAHTAATTFTLSAPLQLHTTYYWEVQGIGGMGAPGTWSAMRSFTTVAPDISVSANGQTIQPGQVITSPATGTDFGTVYQGSSPLPQSFTIENTGDGVLTLGRLTVPQGFIVVSRPPGSLAPGQAATVKVRLKTSAPGTFAGIVSLADNVPAAGQNPFTFSLSGMVIPKPAPVLVVQGDGQTIAPNALPTPTNGTDFGNLVRGAGPVLVTFTIINDGNANLILGNVGVPRGFYVVSEPPKSIAAGASGTFTLGLSTTNLGTFGGVVRFSDNDPRRGENPFTFRVRGVVGSVAMK